MIVAGYLALKFIEEGVKYLSRKVRKVIDNEDNFITDTRCKSCRKEQDQADREFKKEVRENLGQIKGILLVMATEGKVDIDQLSKLVSKG